MPLSEVRAAHAAAKAALLAEVNKRTGHALDPAVFTIGFARRATGYKRADLLFSDVARLKRIAQEVGPIQLLFGGKAHPRDEGGKQIIRRVFEGAAALGNDITALYIEGYDMRLGQLMCAGVDLWLNNPLKPLEASGTSGMKAALNGVPSLSVLDGWWIEGHVEGVTGWSIDDGAFEGADPSVVEAASMYTKLEQIILPLYYQNPYGYAEVMRSAIAVNGSFFNAQRMVAQYVQNAYQIAG